MKNQRGKRNLVVGSLVACGLLAVVPGCANHHDGVHPSPAIIHPSPVDSAMVQSKQQVHVSFYRVGGPAPGAPVPLPGTVTFIGPVVTQVSVGNDGRINTWLPPGHYRVQGVSPLIESGRFPCKPDSRVTVGRNHSAKVTVYCQVP